jgi:hypothetical protein
MPNNAVERKIPGIVPSDGKNYAHIDSRGLKRFKPKLLKPITEQIFGVSSNGKTIIIQSEKQEAPSP